MCNDFPSCNEAGFGMPGGDPDCGDPDCGEPGALIASPVAELRRPVGEVSRESEDLLSRLLVDDELVEGKELEVVIA